MKMMRWMLVKGERYWPLLLNVAGLHNGYGLKVDFVPIIFWWFFELLLFSSPTPCPCTFKAQERGLIWCVLFAPFDMDVLDRGQGDGRSTG